MQNERVLLENHLEFLKTHRGTVTKQADHWIVESDKKEFTFLIVGSTPIPETIQISIFYKTPWSGESNATWLKSNKKHTHTLSYMILDKKQLKTEPLKSELHFKVEPTLQHIEDFSLVQVKGFCPTDESFNEWYPWMRSKNVSNLKTPNQTFYVAYQNEKPIGTALAIKKNHTLGIYAVATLPDFRKQGVSSFLMQKIVSQSQTSDEIVTLQVLKNSYAEKFYLKLGFKIAFEVEVYS
jgi:ribosomal protein S18 acetylase RimI-like enzyme